MNSKEASAGPGLLLYGPSLLNQILFGAGKAKMDEFTITKQTDASSIPLFMNLVSGKKIMSGQLVFVKNTGKGSLPFLTIDLDTVFVSNYQFANDDEIITLQIGGMKMSYASLLKDGGKSGNPITGGWDFIKNQVKK